MRKQGESYINFTNRTGWVLGRFCWQKGFGASPYGHSQLAGIINYIRDQERHHAWRSFCGEYVRFLRRYEVEHDERYVLSRSIKWETPFRG